jgi:hypothetical protein
MVTSNPRSRQKLPWLKTVQVYFYHWLSHILESTYAIYKHKGPAYITTATPKAMMNVNTQSIPRLNAKPNSTTSYANHIPVSCLFIHPEQSSKRVEFVAVLVDICHAASQARL